MEVVSTLNLVFSGTEKANDYAMKGQYEYEAKIYKYEAIRSFMIAEM